MKMHPKEFKKEVIEIKRWDGELIPGQPLKDKIIKNFKSFKAIMRELEKDYNCVVIKQSALDCSVVMRETRQELFTFSLKEIKSYMEGF